MEIRVLHKFYIILKITRFLSINDEIQKYKMVMKNFDDVLVILVLFVLCVSVSLAYVILSKMFFIVYGIIVAIISFGFLYVKTKKCCLLKHGCCFRLLFRVIAFFMFLAVLVCIVSSVSIPVMIILDDYHQLTISGRVLDVIKVICLPFLFVLFESILVMVFKKAYICPKMWL